MNLHQGKTASSKKAHKMHFIWYISSNKVFKQLRNSWDWSSNMLHCAPAPGALPWHIVSDTQDLSSRYTDGGCGPPMSHGMHRPIVFSQLLTIAHKSVKIHEHFLNTIVGTEVQFPCHFAPWQTVLIFKAWGKKRIFYDLISVLSSCDPDDCGKGKESHTVHLANSFRSCV